MIENHILIIGAMKSGTTSLFDLLAQHPKIAPCRPKEPGFFAFEDRWIEGFGWYDSLFAFDPKRHVYALDGSTDYTKQPFCQGVIQRLEASAGRRFKLIYLVRHPLRRIESHAKHAQFAGSEVGTCRSPRRDHSLDAGVSPVSLAVSRYHFQLEPFASFRERGDLLVLVFEEMISDQRAAMRQVWNFLGLDDHVSAPVHKVPGRIRRVQPWYWEFLDGVRPIKKLVKNVVPYERRRALQERLSRRRVELAGRFLLRPDEEAVLWQDLAPECRRLSETYGIDVQRLWGIELGQEDWSR